MESESRMIAMNDGVQLYTSARERGHSVWLIVTHGIGEHFDRHKHYTDLFGQYFNIFYYDLRGHGRSQGERGSIDNFSQFAADLKMIVEHLKSEYRMGRYVLAAHSMGALIASDFLQNHAESDLYPERVFLSAPVVGLSGPLGPIANLLPRNWTNNLASMKFGMQLGGLVDLNCLSHDPRIKQQYTNDPLNILKLHTSLLFGMLDTSKRVFSAPLNLKCPTAIIVGTDDQIVSPEHIEKYFTLIEKGQTLKLIEGGRHELHNEIERYRTPYCEFLKDFLLQVLSKK